MKNAARSPSISSVRAAIRKGARVVQTRGNSFERMDDVIEAREMNVDASAVVIAALMGFGDRSKYRVEAAVFGFVVRERYLNSVYEVRVGETRAEHTDIKALEAAVELHDRVAWLEVNARVAAFRAAAPGPAVRAAVRALATAQRHHQVVEAMVRAATPAPVAYAPALRLVG